MAESVVSLVAGRLGELLNQEVSFLHGVSRQVEEMQIELEMMQSYLEDADKRQDEDKRVQTWVSKIREAAYDAEVIIDTYALKIASRRRRGIQSTVKRYACLINEAAELHKLGSEIEAIKTRISNLTRCLETYGIKHLREGEGSSSVHGRQRQWRQSFSHVEEDAVGLDEDIKTLVAQLVKEDKHCSVVSICGMGGLGKTTLAKMVYNHSEIRRHFDLLAWAYVSQQYQRREVWEGILVNLSSPSKDESEKIAKKNDAKQTEASKDEREKIARYNDADLAKALSKVQKEKKCLVVLDDIWSIEAWETLKSGFPIGEGSSKMLLTTRHKEVPLHVSPSGFHHELKCLDEEEGWKLLKKKAFQKKDEPGFNSMEELGRKMVKKCAGLPLAIVVLGGLLATKCTPNEWEMVGKNINLYLREGKGDEQQHSKVSDVLALSYYELPYRLKPCFLHLGHFPEGFDVPTKKLVLMWVAEGFVSSMQHGTEGKEIIEDAAERYLGELVDRCMVQVGIRTSSGRIKTCRLHDLMRDLCLSKANQENFLRIVDLDRNKLVLDSPSSMVTVAKSTQQVHRLAVYGEETLELFPKQGSTPFIRSLLVFKTNRDNNENFRKMISWFNNFKSLKILDLEKRPIEVRLPREIGNLIHLRYLSVNCSKIISIPSSIGNLMCLQTLILRGDRWNEINVPNMIWKMVQLRHLYFTDIVSRSGKLELGDLRNLQTLQQFDIRNFNVEELTKLTDLRKLDIDMLDNLHELKEILKSPHVNFFDRLHSLKIDWLESTMEETDLQRLFLACHNLYNLYLQDEIVKLPEYFQFPKNLTKLTLCFSWLSEDPMPTLEKLPCLTILRLYRYSFIGEEMVCSSKGFPQLKSLHLLRLPYLEEWRVGEEEIRFVGEEEEEEEWCVGKEASMPNLSHLLIEKCSNLKKIPNGLRFITTLQKLEIVRMPTHFRNRLQQGGEDYDKFRHVPSITFENIDEQ